MSVGALRPFTPLWLDRAVLARAVLLLAATATLACDKGYRVQGVVRGSDCSGGEVAPLEAVEVSATVRGQIRTSVRTNEAEPKRRDETARTVSTDHVRHRANQDQNCS